MTKKLTPPANKLDAIIQASANYSEAEAKAQQSRVIELVEILNQHRPAGEDNINFYESLRREIQDNDKLKHAHGGIVHAGKIMTDALKVYAKQTAHNAGAAGEEHDAIMSKALQPETIYNEVIKNILPGVVDSHIMQLQQENKMGR